MNTVLASLRSEQLYPSPQELSPNAHSLQLYQQSNLSQLNVETTPTILSQPINSDENFIQEIAASCILQQIEDNTSKIISEGLPFKALQYRMPGKRSPAIGKECIKLAQQQQTTKNKGFNANAQCNKQQVKVKEEKKGNSLFRGFKPISKLKSTCEQVKENDIDQCDERNLKNKKVIKDPKLFMKMSRARKNYFKSKQYQIRLFNFNTQSSKDIPKYTECSKLFQAETINEMIPSRFKAKTMITRNQQQQQQDCAQSLQNNQLQYSYEEQQLNSQSSQLQQPLINQRDQSQISPNQNQQSSIEQLQQQELDLHSHSYLDPNSLISNSVSPHQNSPRNNNSFLNFPERAQSINISNNFQISNHRGESSQMMENAQFQQQQQSYSEHHSVIEQSDNEGHFTSDSESLHESELFNIFSSLHVLSVNTEKPGGQNRKNMFSLFNSKPHW